jgi:hypothetical protein
MTRRRSEHHQHFQRKDEMMAKNDNSLKELFEKLEKLWPRLRMLDRDMSTKEVIINPLPEDPEMVPLGGGGAVQFKGYVVNADNAAANLECSMYPILANGHVDLAHPVYDGVSPAVSMDQWIISFILQPNTNYGLYVLLNEVNGSSAKLFFTTSG